MDRKNQLLKRLDDIAEGLKESGSGLALIALGSVGLELERLDSYSDLDFFAVVRQGTKQAFLDDLSWMEKSSLLAYSFRNTADGFKLLFSDGIYGEMAVFEPHELEGIPFAPGRIVYREESFDPNLAVPRRQPQPEPHSTEWCIGEALTCLYVGLCRFRRGEKLSAQRFIQEYAVDRVIELSSQFEAAQPAYADQFNPLRRFELRYPKTASHLSEFIRGYEHSPQSAKAILEFLDQKFEINLLMKHELEKLIDACN